AGFFDCSLRRMPYAKLALAGARTILGLNSGTRGVTANPGYLEGGGVHGGGQGDGAGRTRHGRGSGDQGAIPRHAADVVGRLRLRSPSGRGQRTIAGCVLCDRSASGGGGENDFGDLRLLGVVGISRQRNRSQDGDDRNDDHQFDEGKALLVLHDVSPRSDGTSRAV